MVYTHQSNNASPSKHPATECYYERISLEINFSGISCLKILHGFGITHNTFTVLNSEDFFIFACFYLFPINLYNSAGFSVSLLT